MTVTLEDFNPLSSWEVDTDGEQWDRGGAKHVIDKATGRKYWNESENIVRFKCLLLAGGTSVVHAVAGVVNIAFRIFRLVSGYHFWPTKPGEQPRSLKERMKAAGEDLLRIFTQPIAILALELASIYGIVRPYDGRKLYASIERAQYGHFILAPCFQPDPKSHLFGGDPKKKNAF